jgi:hypothetical protein
METVKSAPKRKNNSGSKSTAVKRTKGTDGRPVDAGKGGGVHLFSSRTAARVYGVASVTKR